MQSPFIFIATRQQIVLRRDMICTTPPSDPPQPSNDNPEETCLTALLQVQEWLKTVTDEQAQDNVPFHRRRRLHTVAKKLRAYEQRMLRKLEYRD